MPAQRVPRATRLKRGRACGDVTKLSPSSGAPCVDGDRPAGSPATAGHAKDLPEGIAER